MEKDKYNQKLEATGDESVKGKKDVEKEPEKESNEKFDNMEAQDSPEVHDTSKDTDVNELKSELEAKSKQCEEYFNRLQRTAAEFDNFKKRTIKEKESLYSEAVSDIISAFLPVLDSIDRAIEICTGEDDSGSVKEGIELVKRQISDVMKNLGVEEIKSLGESFDPQFHNAVMHVEDNQYGKNVVIEEFQKGYKFKERVIRYSMVKVAN
ncbi:MAG: nucleotide exchange factor GrpE [Acetivibrionales bacterium]|jgi:molecular chaperone GrpE